MRWCQRLSVCEIDPADCIFDEAGPLYDGDVGVGEESTHVAVRVGCVRKYFRPSFLSGGSGGRRSSLYSFDSGSLVPRRNTLDGIFLSITRQLFALKTRCPRSASWPTESKFLVTFGTYKTSEILLPATDIHPGPEVSSLAPLAVGTLADGCLLSSKNDSLS